MKTVNYTASKLSRSSRSIVKIGALGVFGLAAMAAAPKSDAQTTNFLLTGDISETAQVNVTHDGIVANVSNVRVGRYKMTFNAGPVVNGWCTDILHGISFGTGYTANALFSGTDPIAASNANGGLNSATGGYYPGGLASALVNGDFTTVSSPTAVARAASASWLADTYLNTTDFNPVGSGNTAFQPNISAIQLSIWDILQDGADGVNNGLVRTDATGSTAYSSLVTFYEAQALSHNNFSTSALKFVQAPVNFTAPSTFVHAQDFLSRTSVPEPGAVAMFVGTGVVGMMGLSMRKRAKK